MHFSAWAACLPLLSLPAAVFAQEYNLVKEYSGQSFFDDWSFYGNGEHKRFRFLRVSAARSPALTRAFQWTTSPMEMSSRLSHSTRAHAMRPRLPLTRRTRTCKLRGRRPGVQRTARFYKRRRQRHHEGRQLDQPKSEPESGLDPHLDQGPVHGRHGMGRGPPSCSVRSEFGPVLSTTAVHPR